ncbi:hypothetical protein HDZ31DRAFT_74652 [Schizophyllum fasciatum]
MPATLIWRKFKTAFPSTSYSIPPRILKPTLSRELFSRLESSRIPKHPLDHDDATTLSEAVDALCIYSRFVCSIPEATKAYKDALFDTFPDVWLWIRFLSPHAGNVMHLDHPPGDGQPPCQLRADGFVTIPTEYMVRSLVSAMCFLLQESDGISLLLSSPGFFTVNLAYLTFPVRAEYAETMYHDYLGHYMQLLNEDFLTKPATLANFRAAWPIDALVRLLDRETSRAGWLDNPGWKQRIIGMWLALLGVLVDAGKSFAGVIAVLRSGFLAVLHRVLVCVEGQPEDSDRTLADWRGQARRITDQLIAALVWPNVLRACRKAFRRTQCGAPNSADPSTWRILIHRFRYLAVARAEQKKVLRRMTSSGCFSPEAGAAMASRSASTARTHRLVTKSDEYSTSSDRAFFKACVHACLVHEGDIDRLSEVATMLVDFTPTDSSSPHILYGHFDEIYGLAEKRELIM